jgi:hypothetical protein
MKPHAFSYSPNGWESDADPFNSASIPVNSQVGIASPLGSSVSGPAGGTVAGVGAGTSGTVTGNTVVSPFVINVTYDSSVASAPAAFKTAIDAAVQYLESQFTDPVTINITIGYGSVNGTPLGANALGQSLFGLNQYSYSQVKAALVADGKTGDDSTALASLPLNDPAPNGGNYWVSTAEAKALGLIANNASTDGYVGFSSTAPFDYNNSDGVTAGQYDFFAVALHEITEIMGRELLVGGSVTLNGGGTVTNSFTPLDLFHYSANGVRDFSGTTP